MNTWVDKFFGILAVIMTVVVFIFNFYPLYEKYCEGSHAIPITSDVGVQTNRDKSTKELKKYVNAVIACAVDDGDFRTSIKSIDDPYKVKIMVEHAESLGYETEIYHNQYKTLEDDFDLVIKWSE